jgi:hypothetical protein
VRLQQFRKEKLSKAGSGGTRVEVHTSQYGVRTAAPADSSFPKPRYEERKPTRSASYDEDKYYDDRSSSRKYPDTYESYPKRSPPRSSREKETPKTTRAATDRSRAEAKKSRDKEERRDRSGKYTYLDDEFSSADEKARFEATVRRREEELRKAEEAEEIRRSAADARRRAEDRRSAEDVRKHRGDDRDDRDHRERKYHDWEAGVKNYIRTKESEARPSPVRTSSRDYHSSRRGSEAPRRSSARPKESSRPMSSGRDRERTKVPAYTEIVDWENDRVPPLKPSLSSPPEVPIVRLAPQRSYTESSGDHGRRRETSPIPGMFRASTMPTIVPSSRRKEPPLSRGHDSGYSTASSPETAFPSIPPPSTKKMYLYPSSGGGVRLSPDDIEVANGHRAVRREPGLDDRHRAGSPPPILSRPPIGSNRVVPPSSSSRYPQPPPRNPTIVPPPPLGRSSTMNMGPERRGEDRGRRLFGEGEAPDYFTRENSRRTTVKPEKVIYAPKPGPEDIRWSSGRDSYPAKDRDYTRPTMRKSETFAY